MIIWRSFLIKNCFHNRAYISDRKHIVYASISKFDLVNSKEFNKATVAARRTWLLQKIYNYLYKHGENLAPLHLGSCFFMPCTIAVRISFERLLKTAGSYLIDRRLSLIHLILRSLLLCPNRCIRWLPTRIL